MTFTAADVAAWPQPATLEEAEAALGAGRLFVFMAHGRYWLARRGGATKLWKRDPARFRVPIKAGFRARGAIEPWNLSQFRVRPLGAQPAPLAAFGKGRATTLPDDA